VGLVGWCKDEWIPQMIEVGFPEENETKDGFDVNTGIDISHVDGKYGALCYAAAHGRTEHLAIMLIMQATPAFAIGLKIG